MTNTDKAKTRERLRKKGWTDVSKVFAGKKHELWQPNMGGPGQLAPMSLEQAIKFQDQLEGK